VSGFTGTDSFTYQAKDPSGALSNTAQVVITVIDRAPTADNDCYQAAQNTTLTVSAANGVLNGDVDPDGDSITAVLVSTTSHGTLTLRSDGSFTYVPASGFTGTDTFTYKASDGTLMSAVATVTITVLKCPTAYDHSYSQWGYWGGVSGNVLDNCTHDSSVTVTSAVLDSNCAHGTVTWNGDGTFSYTPRWGYSGTDTFTFHAVDSAGHCSQTQTVTISIH
jgi:VCBS repeat-containing protein